MLYSGKINPSDWANTRALLVGSGPNGSIGLLPLLKQMGLEAETATSAAQAYHALRTGPMIHIVLCDTVLPDGSWRNVLEMAFQNRCCPAVIVVAEREDAALWMEMVGAGGFDLITRTVSTEALSRLVAQAVQRTLQRQASMRAGVERSAGASASV